MNREEKNPKLDLKEEKRLYTWKWILGNKNYPSGKGTNTIYFLACDGCRIVEDENAKETRIYIDSDENSEKRRKQVNDLKKKYNYMNTKEDAKQYQIAFIKQLNLKHLYFGRLKEKSYYFKCPECGNEFFKTETKELSLIRLKCKKCGEISYIEVELEKND